MGEVRVVFFACAITLLFLQLIPSLVVTACLTWTVLRIADYPRDNEQITAFWDPYKSFTWGWLPWIAHNRRGYLKWLHKHPRSMWAFPFSDAALARPGGVEERARLAHWITWHYRVNFICFPATWCICCS